MKPTDRRITPPEIVEAATEYLGEIGTDPCWEPASYVRARLTYDGSSPEQDGRVQPWVGTVWLNPPYSDPMVWAARAAAHEDAPVAMLVKHDHTTAWWRVATRRASHIVLLHRRIRFPLPDRTTDGVANFPCSVILIPGEWEDGVCLDAWRPLGRVLALG